MDLESPGQELAQLQRELTHVSVQAQVAHTMAMWWRAK
jgi:hypothetical protein